MKKLIIGSLVLVGMVMGEQVAPPMPISDVQAKQIRTLQQSVTKAQRVLQDEELKYTELQRKVKVELGKLQDVLGGIVKSNGAVGYQLTPDLQWTKPQSEPTPAVTVAPKVEEKK